MTSDKEKAKRNPHAYFPAVQDLIYIEARDLYLSQEKQHQIAPNDLRDLANTATDAAHINELLNRYGLVTGEQLNEVDVFLKKLKLHDHPLFKDATLAARLDFYTHISAAARYRRIKKTLVEEAAKVALAQAITPTDFAMRYQFYLCCTKKLRLEEFTSTARQERIAQVQEAMEKALVEYLSGPEICIPPPPKLIWDLLNEWFEQREHLGFADIGTGLLLTAQHITMLDLSAEEIVRAVREFVRHMQIFFRHHHATDALLAQTDERWVYRFTYPEVQARLTLVPGGCLRLEHYQLVCSQLMESTYERDADNSANLQL